MYRLLHKLLDKLLDTYRLLDPDAGFCNSLLFFTDFANLYWCYRAVWLTVTYLYIIIYLYETVFALLPEHMYRHIYINHHMYRGLVPFTYIYLHVMVIAPVFSLLPGIDYTLLWMILQVYSYAHIFVFTFYPIEPAMLRYIDFHTCVYIIIFVIIIFNPYIYL